MTATALVTRRGHPSNSDIPSDSLRLSTIQSSCSTLTTLAPPPSWYSWGRREVWVPLVSLTPATPHPDTLLPPPEWFASSTQSYVLRDLDDTSVVEDGRKKLNTLAHYKVGPNSTQHPYSHPP